MVQQSWGVRLSTNDVIFELVQGISLPVDVKRGAVTLGVATWQCPTSIISVHLSAHWPNLKLFPSASLCLRTSSSSWTLCGRMEVLWMTPSLFSSPQPVTGKSWCTNPVVPSTFKWDSSGEQVLHCVPKHLVMEALGTHCGYLVTLIVFASSASIPVFHLCFLG